MGATDYPKFLAQWKRHFYGWNAANFGWGGDTTQNILWRLQNGELDGVSPKVIVLQAGTNNLPWRGPADQAKVDEVVTGIKAIIGVFQQHAPEAAIVLTGIFPRSQNMSLKETIEQINTQLSKLADGKKIRFLNINDKLADAEGKLLAGHVVRRPASRSERLRRLGRSPEADPDRNHGAASRRRSPPPPTGDPRRSEVAAGSAVSRPSTPRESKSRMPSGSSDQRRRKWHR